MHTHAYTHSNKIEGFIYIESTFPSLITCTCNCYCIIITDSLYIHIMYSSSEAPQPCLNLGIHWHPHCLPPLTYFSSQVPPIPNSNSLQICFHLLQPSPSQFLYPLRFPTAQLHYTRFYLVARLDLLFTYPNQPILLDLISHTESPPSHIVYIS